MPCGMSPTMPILKSKSFRNGLKRHLKKQTEVRGRLCEIKRSNPQGGIRLLFLLQQTNTATVQK